MKKNKWVLVILLSLHMIFQCKDSTLFLALFVVDSSTIQYQNIMQYLTFMVAENFGKMLIDTLFVIAQTIGIIGLVKEKKWAVYLVIAICIMSIFIHSTTHFECTILAIIISSILMTDVVKRVD